VTGAMPGMVSIAAAEAAAAGGATRAPDAADATGAGRGDEAAGADCALQSSAARARTATPAARGESEIDFKSEAPEG